MWSQLATHRVPSGRDRNLYDIVLLQTLCIIPPYIVVYHMYI